MAISLLDSLSIKKQSPDVERQLFNDITAMVAFDERYLPDVYEANIKSDGSRWRFNRNNDIDATTGKWREVKSGGGVGDVEASEDEDQNFITNVEIVEGVEEELECTKITTTIGNEITTIITANADSSNPNELKAGDVISIKKEIDGIVIYEYNFIDNNEIISPFD